MALQIDDDGNVYDDGVIDGNSDNEFVIPTPSSGSQGWQQDELGNFYKIDSSGGLTFRDDKGTDYTYNPSKGGFTDSKGNLAGGGNTVIDFLKKYGNKALDLFKDAKTGKTDWTKVLAMAGGAYAASRPNNIPPTGYQGKIPKLTASRNMLTAPPVGRRPGSGGIDYGGGVTYRDEAGKVLSSNERTLEELRQAAINNPFNRGATYEGQQALGQSDLASLLALLNQTTPGTTTPSTPVTTAPVTTAPGTGSPGSGASSASVTKAIQDWYRANEGKGDQAALDRWLATSGYTAEQINAALPQWGVADLRKAINEAKSKQTGGPSTEFTTGLGSSTPTQPVPLNSMNLPVGGFSQADRDIALAQQNAEFEARKARRAAMRADMAAKGEDVRVANTAPDGAPQFTVGQGSDPNYNPGPREPLNSFGLPLAGPKQEDIDAGWARQNAEMAERKARREAFGASGLPGQFVISGHAPGKGTYSMDTGESMLPYVYADGKWTDPNVSGTKNVSAIAPKDDWMSNLSYNANAMPQNFDWQKYVATNTDLGAAGIDTAAEAMRHYQNYGIAEKRSLGLAKGGLARDGFVVPADVVSHFGNGSSEAGLKLLAERIGATPIKGEGDGMSDSIKTKIDGVQEARVANDEAYVSPEMVARLGNGSPEKGARKLYAMMDKIRKARTGSTEQGKEIDPNKYMPGGSVQRYQTGGTTATTRPVGATGSESSLSNWAGDYVTNMLAQGAALANAPYQAYTGPLTAGASGLQQQGFAQAGNLRTPGSIGQAAGTAGGIANLAANMRYTPQTTDFLGGANMSGLGMAPSYGMPQQPTGTTTNPIPMPRPGITFPGSAGPGAMPPADVLQQISQNPTLPGTNVLPARQYPQDQPLPSTNVLPSRQISQNPTLPGTNVLPANELEYTGGSREYGGSQYDPVTGFESRDLMKLQPGDPRLEGAGLQTKPFRGESSEPFMQDGAMTGGVMSPPGQGAGLPGLMQGQQGMQQPQASQPVGSIAQQYMNPYLQSALNPMMDEARRQADISRMDDAGRLTRAGAFGGGRQAIMESEGRRNLMDKQNQLLTMGYSTAYDKAMQQFNADQARRAQEAQFGATFGLQGLQTGIQGAQAQGQLGAQQSQSDINNLRAIMDAGAVERGIESEGIAADKKQFEEARLNPFNMLQFQQSLLSGMPLASQSYSMPGQSNLQQFAGGATTIQQLLDILSGKKTAAAK